MLRYHGKILCMPQAIPVAAGLAEDDRAGTWYLIRADVPADAFSHQRQLLARVEGHKSAGHCQCPAETVGEGTWNEVLRLAAATGMDIMPRHVPDVRVSISRIPRCNEIIGDGQWTIPANCR
jgi:hypothetical protein